MSLSDTEYLIPIAIGLLWSIQTCGIGYILIFYLFHEFYIQSRIKLFGKISTGIITGTSRESIDSVGSDNNHHKREEHFVHYTFQLNPPYSDPIWSDRIKINEAYYNKNGNQ